MNSNLAFGRNGSYLTHYLAQGVSAGRVPRELASDNYRYHPLGTDDLTQAVLTSFERLSEAKGQVFNVNGKESATLRDVIGVLERSLNKGEGSTKRGFSIPLLEHVEEFFVGITHDRNMIRFAQEFDSVNPNLDANDFFKKFHLTHQNTLEKEYTQQFLSDQELVFPVHANYKLTSLD